MYIGAFTGCLGLRGAAAHRSATWPLAPVGLGAASHTCDSLYAIAPILIAIYNTVLAFKERVCRAMRRDGIRTQAVLIGLFVAFLWSTSWVLIKIGLKDIPALTFAGIRYSLASVCLLPVLLLRDTRSQIRLLARHFWMPLIGLGVLLYAITQGAMFLALYYMPAVSVNLLWSFSVVVIALLGILWLGERPTYLQWIGVGILTGGAVLYYYPAGFQVGQHVGLLVCAIGVLANAGAAILGRSINRSRVVSPVIVTVISMSVGSAVLLPIAIAVQGLPSISLSNWLILGWLAVVNTAAAFTLWNKALRVLSATESGIINCTMLVWIPALAVIFLQEKVGLKEIIALALVVLGTLAVQIKRLGRARHLNAAQERPKQRVG